MAAANYSLRYHFKCNKQSRGKLTTCRGRFRVRKRDAAGDKQRMELRQAGLTHLLRSAEWLTAARARTYSRILAIELAILFMAWFGSAFLRGELDFSGQPIGPDFAPYWTAAKLALAGDPGAAYDPAIHYARERELFGGGSLGGSTPFLYPPLFLLICLPFAMLPYRAALSVWLGLGLVSYWRSVRAIWPRKGLALPILAFPAVLINVVDGQNGLLSASLFAAATLQLDRRPIVAGVCFGCLAYKPHLGIVIPFVLLLSREWTAILSAAVTVLLFLAASLIVFDPAVWTSFLSASSFARHLLEQGLAGPHRMVSVFAAAQLWHAPVWAAYAAQIVSGLVVLTALAVVLRRPAPLARGAAICAAAPLVSPYLFDYDLAILAVPIAWVTREAEADGYFLPWEKFVLFAAFILPLVTRRVAMVLALPIGPVIIASLFFVVLRRAAMRKGQFLRS